MLYPVTIPAYLVGYEKDWLTKAIKGYKEYHEKFKETTKNVIKKTYSSLENIIRMHPKIEEKQRKTSKPINTINNEEPTYQTPQTTGPYFSPNQE